MSTCSVPFCTSKRKKCKGEKSELSFHEFPMNSLVAEQWLKNISRKDFVPNTNSNNSVVCSLHFKDDDYALKGKINRLKPEAVPSIFPGYPHYKVPIIKPPRRQLKKYDLPARKQYKTKYVPPTTNEFKETLTARCDKACQTIKGDESLNNMKQALNRLRVKVTRLNNAMQKKQSELEESLRKLKCIERNEVYKALQKVEIAGNAGYLRATFLLEQLHNYSKKRPSWSNDTIRECVVLQFLSPKGYKHIRKRGFLRLPANTTLKKFVGSTDTSTGITLLIKERLVAEAKSLQTEEKFSSLILDEMSISAKLVYDRKVDAFFGYKDEINKADATNSNILANRVLCFVLRGLSTNYQIPSAFYFTKELTGEELFRLTLTVLKEIEKCGFLITRVVSDNLKVNVTMMNHLCGGSIKPVITHPLDENRQLFLSFDQCHIIKNIRSLFLEREMTDGAGIISGQYVKLLYQLQKEETIKPVRYLTRKHVEPSNLEKMDVRRAKEIFSQSVIATISYLKQYSFSHPMASKFADADATITFMTNVKKWYEIHDISNRTHAITSRNANKEVFIMYNDERLEWLEKDFLPYLESIRLASKKLGKKFLTNETHEAIKLTTKSTVGCVRYLLENGYHYILTRPFSSDPVESLFSALRQMSGGNDQQDSRSVIISLQKILKTGILCTTEFGNVENPATTLSMKENTFQQTRDVHMTQQEEVISPILPQHVLDILDELSVGTETQRSTMKTAALAYVGGYILRTVEERVRCMGCIDCIGQPSANSPLVDLITKQDSGSLLYPKPSLIAILSIVQRFVEEAVLFLPKENVMAALSSYVVPSLSKCIALQCPICEDSAQEILALIITEKFVRPLLVNIARNETDKFDSAKFLRFKPLNRKVLKL